MSKLIKGRVDYNYVQDKEEYEALKGMLIEELSLWSSSETQLTASEEQIVKEIKSETDKWNRNNVTRTQAYFNFYQKNPEIHWALLAHMVSRNGGFNMTDLKSSSMDCLFSDIDREKYFLFLESANLSIFCDAYPQLLLYERSKRTSVNFRKLLPVFHISRFMYPVWEVFCKEKNSILLTVGLIINEQSMLEERIVKNSVHADVMHTFKFHLQELLGYTVVSLPYKKMKKPHGLTGLTIERFADLQLRIEAGKILYRLLYQHQKMFKGILQFAQSTPHTGSRHDYWPHLYTSKEKAASKLIYSPRLTDAWEDVVLKRPKSKDWFVHAASIREIEKYPIVQRSDISKRVQENVKEINEINKLKSYLK